MQIRVDVDAFLQRCQDIATEVEQIAALLRGRQVLDISYEELAADTSACVARVAEYLGVVQAQSAIEPALKKVGAADLSDVVSNYQELLDNPATRTLALSE